MLTSLQNTDLQFDRQNSHKYHISHTEGLDLYVSSEKDVSE